MATCISAAYEIKPGSYEVCRKAIEDFVEYVRLNEPSTRHYLSLRSKEDPNRFLHLMVFQNDAAEDRHRNSEAVKHFTEVLHAHTAGEIVFRGFELIAGK